MWVLLNKEGEILQQDKSWIQKGLTKGKVLMKLIEAEGYLPKFKELFEKYPEAETISEVQSAGPSYELKGMSFSRSKLTGAK
jgi:hypothetical protein